MTQVEPQAPEEPQEPEPHGTRITEWTPLGNMNGGW